MVVQLVGHKKVECFAHEKSRNMAKKVNKTFTKPKRVEDVSLAKSGLLDEIKDETSEDGCSSGRSDLEVDQEASSLEPGHEVVCGIKGKEIERALGVDEEGLMVKKTTHEGSHVLNRSWSKGSSTGASGRDAVLVILLQQGLGRMVMFLYLVCISHGGEKHIWYGSFQSVGSDLMALNHGLGRFRNDVHGLSRAVHGQDPYDPGMLVINLGVGKLCAKHWLRAIKKSIASTWWCGPMHRILERLIGSNGTLFHGRLGKCEDSSVLSPVGWLVD
ncbi:hypothetical protein F2Q70_00015640 [Brassica cretica]|uniref:Uncharacterized protein n=1 Tax=Brassica cretica TaxID=69181 RepID=A0A8S9HX50_BRACR|nr:hypothetical protein F2Q70_00015640 [Brassica cretica]